MKEIFLCSICNVSSGSCVEDCSFCTQSLHNGADIEKYKEKSLENILEELNGAKEYGALGFCLVTSGKSLDEKKCEYISKVAKKIKSENDNIHLIACCGVASKESLLELKKAGVDSYNHNLETSKSFYENICSTHDWDERYKSCENVKSVGLMLCSGGIFGLGESKEDRIELLKALQDLEPESSPINFFHPNSALPIKADALSRDEALECIKLSRDYLKNTRLMIAAGRSLIFGENQKEIFDAGVDAIVLGNYLTTKGADMKCDIDMLNRYDIKIATSCH